MRQEPCQPHPLNMEMLMMVVGELIGVSWLFILGFMACGHASLQWVPFFHVKRSQGAAKWG